MSALFAFKLTLVPFFILALSLAGRRWGTAVSGWLVALPVVAGPIVFFIGMEQGEAFAAGAARASTAAWPFGSDGCRACWPVGPGFSSPRTS
jgi:hypothetical protein